jgi:hypothetical protein
MAQPNVPVSKTGHIPPARLVRGERCRETTLLLRSAIGVYPILMSGSRRRGTLPRPESWGDTITHAIDLDRRYDVSGHDQLVKGPRTKEEATAARPTLVRGLTLLHTRPTDHSTLD